MSERKKPHNGRDLDGDMRVKRADFDDKLADPDGPEHIRDDVRLGGAVADTGPHAGERAAQISDLVEQNRENVKRSVASEDTEAEGR